MSIKPSHLQKVFARAKRKFNTKSGNFVQFRAYMYMTIERAILLRTLIKILYSPYTYLSFFHPQTKKGENDEKDKTKDLLDVIKNEHEF